MSQAIGRRIARRRKDRQWNQSELARRAGCRPSYILRLEAGGIGRPSVERLTLIADALGCRLADLTEDGQATPLVEELAAELAVFGNDEQELTLLRDIIRYLASYSPSQRRWVLSALKMVLTERPDRVKPATPANISDG